jgi:hypothetical protein
MGYHAGASDIRNVMGVAIQLRQLANHTANPPDRKLYLTAATALEERAKTLAVSLPGDVHDKVDVTDLHRPVDLKV